MRFNSTSSQMKKMCMQLFICLYGYETKLLYLKFTYSVAQKFIDNGFSFYILQMKKRSIKS